MSRRNVSSRHNPTSFFLGGGALGGTRKFRNVQRGGAVAFVVDDLAATGPWTPRGVEIRGTAVALTDHEPPVPGLAREIIRITPPRSFRGAWTSHARAARCDPGTGDVPKLVVARA
ncbi:hypothetical protein [Nonomuraea sp. NPDC050783]|uniref:hypothetical protein n=1 Tax=Nonomuraea sp. NPDC050783 TaxID=3154634 RepID=UPI0034654D64